MARLLRPDFLASPDAWEEQMGAFWEQEGALEAVLEARKASPPYVFYEGPPTANGKPGIHHVLARALKDTICRYWTMRGRRVLRKAGWDTHGLPVELEVEKRLGLDGKAAIEAIGIGPFNQACRDSVFTYQEEWERISRRIGFLLDYDHPYVTYHKDYIESVWFLLSRFAANGLLEKGHKVLPWCGRCGTGLSSHEVGQGYQDVDDPSVWVSFPLRNGPGLLERAALVAWTTTPWTLPSNMAACVHPDFSYAVLEHEGGKFVLLESLASSVFADEEFDVLGTVPGMDLVGLDYEPLFEWQGGEPVLHGKRKHVVVADSFVTDAEGTGIVHLAPYGADDFRIARAQDLQGRLLVGRDGTLMVSIADAEAGTDFRTANVALMSDLNSRGRLLRREQHRHSYPHCWRCDTPLFYMPSPAWFLRTTIFKERMVTENGRIAWSPPEIGTGRFGEWLENNVDWALSRDRYWGTPLPVWSCSEDSSHWTCMGSFADLAAKVGGLADDFDPHRPTVDALVYPCEYAECGGTMQREQAVIDCWFDSGAMPLAQYHWPFENREIVAEQFPADFIAEGLDQTRGWFYTLHAIGVFLTCVDEELWQSGELDGQPLPRLTAGSAYRSVMVNGLLLDAEGRKMSKRLGNIVDPFAAVAEHGADAIRWSLLAGGAAHLSRRFDDSAIEEVRRRVLGTLISCHDFLALYAETEGWDPSSPRPAVADREALDRWILSRTTACASACAKAFEELDPARAIRRLEALILDEISNWYVRRSRRRFWGAAGADTQASAFATLQEVLESVALMVAPVIPFLADHVWRSLRPKDASVHLQNWPEGGERDLALEQSVEPILRAAGLGRAVRERVGIRVRQPLARMVLHIAPMTSPDADPKAHEASLREELNVKEVEWIEGTPDFLEVRAKANFKRLGSRAGKDMKALADTIAKLDRDILFQMQAGESLEVSVGETNYTLSAEDVLLETTSLAGMEAASDGRVTLGLVTELTPELQCEGLARELINRIQGLRRSTGLDISDRIHLRLAGSSEIQAAVKAHFQLIAEETLAEGGLEWSTAGLPQADSFAIPGGHQVQILVQLLSSDPA